MAQKEIELILTRQLASHLATPIFLVDATGVLVYFNEPAEAILGQRFEETGELPAEALAQVFHTTSEDGRPLPAEELPLVIALQKGSPSHKRFFIRGLDGVRRCIEATALPLVGHGGRRIGAMAAFWEVT